MFSVSFGAHFLLFYFLFTSVLCVFGRRKEADFWNRPSGPSALSVPSLEMLSIITTINPAVLSTPQPPVVNHQSQRSKPLSDLLALQSNPTENPLSSTSLHPAIDPALYTLPNLDDEDLEYEVKEEDWRELESKVRVGLGHMEVR